ncbi:LysR family transcriptional regulator [Solibacillus sp. FSL K6-1126]|uniref:LysR family transcriptional regulator n=1 Tax=Solibacillus sp. FSL K6-1126 TaxID=2921463 RepID=UPI0030FA5A5E
MELRQLEYFLMLCEEMQFTRAAERLNIAQPTLSQQIKVLENEVNTPLFHRIGKKITLTEAGQILYRQAQTIFQTLHTTKIQMQQLASLEKGILRIGALPGELTNIVSDLVLKFMHKFPHIQVTVTSGEDIHTLLKNNKIDIGFSFSPLIENYDEQFVEIPLYTEQFCYVESKDSAAQHEPVQLRDILNEPLVLFPNAHLCRRILNAAAKSDKLTIEPKFETSSIPAIFQFVEQGLGGTIVAKTLFDLHVSDKLHAHIIQHPLLERETLLIYQKERLQSPAFKAFLDLLEPALTNYQLSFSANSL